MRTIKILLGKKTFQMFKNLTDVLFKKTEQKEYSYNETKTITKPKIHKVFKKIIQLKKPIDNKKEIILYCKLSTSIKAKQNLNDFINCDDTKLYECFVYPINEDIKKLLFKIICEKSFFYLYKDYRNKIHYIDPKIEDQRITIEKQTYRPTSIIKKINNEKKSLAHINLTKTKILEKLLTN